MRWPNLAQKLATFELIDYAPFPEQLPVHASRADVIQIVGAEGAGKSAVTAAELVAAVPWSKLIYLIGETYDNPRREFEYMRNSLLRLGAVDLAAVATPKMGEWQMTTRTGCRIRTLSAREGASAVIATGEEPDIFCLTEAGIIQSYGVFTACARRATRSRGRVILSGTLKDNYGWYAGLSNDLAAPGNIWRGETFSIPAWANTQLYPGGRADPEIARLALALSEDEFARTVAARRVPSRALVFPEFSYAVHVRPCPFDPELPVSLWVDPGYNPSVYAVLAVQLKRDDYGDTIVEVIDEVCLNFHTHKQIIGECQKRVWWANTLRGTHVIDIAGRAHAASDSAVEVWSTEAGVYFHTNKVGIMDGISRHRDFLQGTRPRLFHDPERCRYTLEEYGKYRRPTDRDGNPTADEPKDEFNHSMKALAYGLVHQFGLSDRNRTAKAATIQRAGLREGLRKGGYY